MSSIGCSRSSKVRSSSRVTSRTRKLLQTTNSPAPECRRRLEPPPSPAQRFRHRDLVAGLPAGHRADGEMQLRLVGLPDRIEKDAGGCDIARASQTALALGETR